MEGVWGGGEGEEGGGRGIKVEQYLPLSGIKGDCLCGGGGGGGGCGICGGVRMVVGSTRGGGVGVVKNEGERYVQMSFLIHGGGEGSSNRIKGRGGGKGGGKGGGGEGELPVYIIPPKSCRVVASLSSVPDQDYEHGGGGEGGTGRGGFVVERLWGRWVEREEEGEALLCCESYPSFYSPFLLRGEEGFDEWRFGYCFFFSFFSFSFSFSFFFFFSFCC